MLFEKRVKATVEFQGRVVTATGDARRWWPRWPRTGDMPHGYRDTRGARRFRRVLLWGTAVVHHYSSGRVFSLRAYVHVEALPWVSGQQ